MNREQAKELAPLVKELSTRGEDLLQQLAEAMEAFAQGKSVQYHNNHQWNDTDNPQFQHFLVWRVKPEQKEFWIVVYDNAGTEKYSPTAHSSLESARCMASAGILHAKIYHCTGEEVT